MNRRPTCEILAASLLLAFLPQRKRARALSPLFLVFLYQKVCVLLSSRESPPPPPPTRTLKKDFATTAPEQQRIKLPPPPPGLNIGWHWVRDVGVKLFLALQSWGQRINIKAGGGGGRGGQSGLPREIHVARRGPHVGCTWASRGLLFFIAARQFMYASKDSERSSTILNSKEVRPML